LTLLHEAFEWRAWTKVEQSSFSQRRSVADRDLHQERLEGLVPA
jgi:hypothetical protein